MNGDWKPTAKLRWTERTRASGSEEGTAFKDQVLQQWHAPDVPAYLQNDREGEWRDVEVASE